MRVNDEFEGQPDQTPCFLRTPGKFDQAQGFAICADQDMQAVIERHAVDLYPARPPAERPRRLEDRDGDVAAGELGRRRHPGIAATNYGYARPRVAG